MGYFTLPLLGSLVAGVLASPTTDIVIDAAPIHMRTLNGTYPDNKQYFKIESSSTSGEVLMIYSTSGPNFHVAITDHTDDSTVAHPGINAPVLMNTYAILTCVQSTDCFARVEVQGGDDPDMAAFTLGAKRVPISTLATGQQSVASMVTPENPVQFYSFQPNDASLPDVGAYLSVVNTGDHCTYPAAPLRVTQGMAPSDVDRGEHGVVGDWSLNTIDASANAVFLPLERTGGTFPSLYLSAGFQSDALRQANSVADRTGVTLNTQIKTASPLKLGGSVGPGNLAFDEHVVYSLSKNELSSVTFPSFVRLSLTHYGSTMLLNTNKIPTPDDHMPSNTQSDKDGCGMKEDMVDPSRVSSPYSIGKSVTSETLVFNTKEDIKDFYIAIGSYSGYDRIGGEDQGCSTVTNYSLAVSMPMAPVAISPSSCTRLLLRPNDVQYFTFTVDATMANNDFEISATTDSHASLPFSARLFVQKDTLPTVGSYGTATASIPRASFTAGTYYVAVVGEVKPFRVVTDEDNECRLSTELLEGGSVVEVALALSVLVKAPVCGGSGQCLLVPKRQALTAESNDEALCVCNDEHTVGAKCDQKCPISNGQICGLKGNCYESRDGHALCACQDGWTGPACNLAATAKGEPEGFVSSSWRVVAIVGLLGMLISIALVCYFRMAWKKTMRHSNMGLQYDAEDMANNPGGGYKPPM